MGGLTRLTRFNSLTLLYRFKIMLDVHKIRDDFPILQRTIRGKPLVYLDTAATAQKPRQVIEAQKQFEESSYANVHRGIHALSEEATAAFEGARKTVAQFLGASDPSEIVFVRNATEGINIISNAWGETNVRAGDEILLTRMEHHANFVPWLELARKTGAKVVIAELTTDGRLDLDDFSKKLTTYTKIVAVSLMSNALGTINPVAAIAEIVKRNCTLNPVSCPLIVIDAAQAASRLPIDVNRLGIDALVFSGHKLYGPTGIGVLWMKKELLETMPPFETGGQMIREVWDDRAEWNDVPLKFEAGTPNITGAVGLAVAIDYVTGIGMDTIREHERELTRHALERFFSLPGIATFGPADPESRGGLVSFVHKTLHAHDVASLLDEEGIAIRAGHHCTMPLHKKLGVAATARASFGIYTTKEELDVFFNALRDVITRFS